MTLLELAKYKECSLQAILAQIEQATGERIPLKKDHEVSENILRILVPEIFRNPKRHIVTDRYDRHVVTPAPETLCIGKEYDGIVDRIESYGIFVRIGKASGLVHQTELAWGPIHDLEKMFKRGDSIRVKVLALEQDGHKHKITLSRKQCLSNPWDTIAGNLKPGNIIEGIVRNIVEFGVFIELVPGMEGLLHISEMPRRQYETLKASAPKPSPIKVVVLDVNIDKKQIKLSTLPLIKRLSGIWNGTDERYVPEKSYPATVVGFDVTRGVWAEFEEGVEALIPLNELQWPQTESTVDWSAVGNTFRITITDIDKFNHRLLGSIKKCTPDPWSLANVSIAEGAIISVIVLQRNVRSIKIVTDDEFRLLGEVPLSELSWQKSADELAPAEIPCPGERMKARIVVWNLEKRTLKASIRQIDRNPWNDIRIGTEIAGSVTEPTEKGETRILLENGLYGLSGEPGLCTRRGETIDFKIIGYNPYTREIRLSHKRILSDNRKDSMIRSFFAPDETTVNRESRSNPNLIIHEGGPDFQKGILMPHNITFQRSPIALPFARFVIESIREGKASSDKICILSRFGPAQEFAVLGYDATEFLKSDDLCECLNENVLYKATVLARTPLATIISVNGRYGYISARNLADNIASELNVCLIEKSKNPFAFSEFAQELPKEGTENIPDEDSESIEMFLTHEELSVIDDTDRTVVEWTLVHCPRITRKNINVVGYELHLTYNMDAIPDLAVFLQKRPNYFKENNFWLSSYVDKEGQTRIILYDRYDLVIEILVSQNGLRVNEFSHDRNKSNAQWLLNHNSKAISICGRNIFLHEQFYTGDNFEALGLKVFRQFDIATRILPGLKKKIRTLKEKAGVEYLTLKEYLRYQENRENTLYNNHAVNVNAGVARIDTSWLANHPTALLIPNVLADCSVLFSESDSDTCHVLIQVANKTLKGLLQDAPQKQGYLLSFYHSHLDMDSIRRSGFELRRRPSTRHLKMQQGSIDNFVHGYNNFDIFDKLNNGTLIAPEPAIDLTFFDEKFNSVEPGNNQQLAIRKAVNNSDIFLIQGPPGTGKTSIIVEIVKQLAINKNERVLVCSQAHSAVENIYNRLCGDDRLKIGNIDIEETMVPDDLQEHIRYLQQNQKLLDMLAKTPQDAPAIKEAFLRDCNYTSSSRELFLEQHASLCDDFERHNQGNTLKITQIINQLHRSLSELGDDAKVFNDARHYRSLNVVMGTCIGIGMDTGLLKSGIVFDTVIIDEAGKANLSETTVPMQLGKKYILVGDEKQLPPYMDSEEISDFLETNSRLNLSKEEVENAISSSLFEDFLRETQHFPEESKVLLNFQYRMNPEIGDYISTLFYDGQLRNGRGTEQQVCDLESFGQSVTFIDTTTTEKTDGRNIAFEAGSPDSGWYNPREITIFKERVLPKLLHTVSRRPELRVGIITPYRRQRSRLQQELADTPFCDNVYTIDSIQGSEFDIVVLSFVRAFAVKKDGRTVGFLDDMRRLNVALSRAKRKLILIGNLRTLCSEDAHSMASVGTNRDLNPVSVFKTLKALQDKIAAKTSLDLLRQHVQGGSISEKHIFKDCEWQYDTDSAVFSIKIDDDRRWFKLQKASTSALRKYANPSEHIDVKFIKFGDKDGRAQFEYIPHIPIAQQITDGVIKNITGRLSDWLNEEETQMLMEFEDGSTLTLEIDPWDDFLRSLLNGSISIPLFITQDRKCLLDKWSYVKFQDFHKEGQKVIVKIINDENMKYFIVECEGVFGKVMRNFPLHVDVGKSYSGTIYRMFKKWAIFNLD